MKHFNFLMAAALLAAAGLQARADVNPKMVLNGSDGKKEISVSSISRITFQGNRMNIVTADGTTGVDVLSLDNITFDLSSSAVESIVKDFNDGITLAARYGVLSVSAPDHMPVTVDVFSTAGTRVLSANGLGSLSVDLNTLAPGVYIVKANNKTLKFTR